MNKHEIIEQLNDLAERARDGYIHTNDEVAKKDNDAIMAAITMIGPSTGDTEGKDVPAPPHVRVSAFGEDVMLLHELKTLADKWERSAKSSPMAASFLGFMAPGLPRGMIEESINQTRRESAIVRRAYDRLAELLDGAAR